MPEPGTSRQLALVVNTSSGRFVRGGADSLAEAVTRHAAIKTVWSLDEISPDRLATACQDGIFGLAIAGGDGTIRSVAQMAQASKADCPLLPLPFGTANLLVKRLYGDREPLDLLDMAAGADSRDFRPGLLNGSLFLVAAALGFPSTIARAREKLREFEGAPPLPSFSKRVAASVRQAFSPGIHYRTDLTGRSRKRASGIYVDLSDMDAETMRFIAVKWREMGDVARLGWALLSDPERLPAGLVSQVDASSRKPLAAMIDGEPVFTESTVEIRRAEHPIQFLSPAS